MTSQCISASLQGFTSDIITVETDTLRGLPAMTITGLPDSTIRESRDRIRTAIENAGFMFPPKNYIVNLAPAHMKKTGSSHDLAIACSLLVATGQMDPMDHVPLVGELALDGSIRPVHGVLSMTLALLKKGYGQVAVPRENAAEASASGELRVYPVGHLSQVMDLQQGLLPEFVPGPGTGRPRQEQVPDFSDIRGQETAIRAMEIAATGMHNILLYGSPGSGKTMLARRVPGIIPALDRDQALETTMIHSSSGILEPGQGLLEYAPFRSPHHTSSYAAMAGGGTMARAGEVSLAHNGVLFLDELTEFSRHTLQTLRQPLEDHVISVNRSALSVTYPARFMLIAAANPCACGNLLDDTTPCTCSAQSLKTYRQKLNNPVMDRIDMEVPMNRIPWEKLHQQDRARPSREIRERVIRARNIQKERFGTSLKHNGSMEHRDVTRYCVLEPQGEKLLEQAYRNLHMTARSYHRVLKVARTIADLAESTTIKKEHLLEALAYRGLQQRLDQVTV